MGFVPGTRMRVVTVHNGNVIVNLRETRVAIGKEIADKIIVSSKYRRLYGYRVFRYGSEES